MNRTSTLTLFLALTLLAWVAVLINVGLLVMQRNRAAEASPTPIVIRPQELVTFTPIWIPPSPTPVPLPTGTATPRSGPPAAALAENSLALDFDLAAIRPETFKAKLFEPVIGRPPSTTFVYCPQNFAVWQPVEPATCYNVASGIFSLAGFQPNETVRIVRYVDGAFAGTAELRLDAGGRGLLTAGSPITDVFVIRQNGAYISNDPALGSPYTF